LRWLALRGNQPDPPSLSAAAPDARERLRRERAPGAAASASSDAVTVVVPESPIQVASAQRLGWWRAAPTGQTNGVMDNGFHSASNEYNQTTQVSTPLQNARRLMEYVRDANPRLLHRQIFGGQPGAYSRANLQLIGQLQHRLGEILTWAEYLGYF